MEAHYPFELMTLAYGYDALEPYIDRQTVEIHHTKHLKGYVDKLNAALEPYTKFHSWGLGKLIINCDFLPKNIAMSVKNNAGGVYNHNFYFNIMRPPQMNLPQGSLYKAIVRQFSSFESFKQQFEAAAASLLGSGWVWLAVNRSGTLKIVTTPNQNTVLPMFVRPLLVIDVWEHAYYLQYQNRRGEYASNWWSIVNWQRAEQIFIGGSGYI
ncbi:MAG TPA: superoxide dismutase [Ruminococcaceae bacterium]|nr:superoxide dismutase [Oscillospiraceae bacterium]